MKDLAIDSRVFLNDKLDCALQEIDLLLNTNNTELIGDINFGVELESFLWTLTPTTAELQKYISEKIDRYTYYCKQYNVGVDVTFLAGEYRSIYLVQISLRLGDRVVAVKKYQYQ